MAASSIEITVGALLILALAALVFALRAAARGPGGIGSLFVESTPSSPDPHAAAELRDLIAEARALADELAGSFDDRAAGMAGLIREAEQSATRLERTLRECQAARALPAQPHAERMIESKARDPFSISGGDPMAGEIYRLADQGLAPVDIAGRLGQHTGKVELILALRRGVTDRS